MHFKYNLDSVNTYNSSTIDLHERLQDWLFRWKNAMFDSVVHELVYKETVLYSSDMCQIYVS